MNKYITSLRKAKIYAKELICEIERQTEELYNSDSAYLNYDDIDSISEDLDKCLKEAYEGYKEYLDFAMDQNKIYNLERKLELSKLENKCLWEKLNELEGKKNESN